MSIVEFYLGVGVDSNGRTFEDMMNFNLRELEFHHDYIQWLFPLNEPSSFHEDAPVLTEEDLVIFKNNESIKSNMLKAFDLMIDFYWLTQSDGKIVKADFWDKPRQDMREHHWISKYNHNYLRLTRILKSLKLVGLNEQAIMLFDTLNNLYEEYPDIGERSLGFWKEAIS